MMDYSHTKSRILQWLGLILIIGVFAGAYWYFKVYGSTLNQSQNDWVTNGLIGMWSFNGDDVSGATAYDRSGSGYNGTRTNNPTLTKGKVGQAMAFVAASSTYVSTADVADIDYVTITAWVKASSPSAMGYVLTKNYDGSNVPFSLNVGGNSSPGALNGMAFYDGSWRNSDIRTDVRADGLWHHVAGTYDGTTLKYYVDGVLDTSSTEGSGVLPKNNQLVDIGRYAQDGHYFGGDIDEVRLYNRALGASEIQSLFTQGSGTKVNTSISNPQGTGRLDSGLAAYWKLDENTGTSTSDGSTNAATGTLTLGPTWTTGQIGTGVTCDGTDDYVTASAIAPQKPITLAAWVKRSASGEADYIFYERDSAAQEDGMALYITTNNKVGFGFNIYTTVESTGTITDTNWHHVAAVVNSANLVTLYIDGAASGTGTPSTPNSGITIPYPIMCGTTAGNFVTGARSSVSIDELRIYPRLFSGDEVSQLYRLTSPTAVDANLDGYWSLDGQDTSSTTTYDRSGAGNTGTLTGGPTKVTGRVGQGLDFDGTDDYVSVADNAALDAGGTDDLTVTGWLYRDSYSTDDVVVAKRTGMSVLNTGYALVVNGTDELFFEVSDGSNEYSVMSGAVFTGPGWYHVTAVWDQDSASGTELYINGVPTNATDAGVVGNIGSITNSEVLAIGAESDAGAPFDGKLDEIRVYKRTLSVAEIKGLYDVGEADKSNSSISQAQGTGRLDSGLAGYWALDDGTSGATPTTAVDASTNGNTGTLTGGPTWTTGQVGNAVDFSESEHYITVADADTLDIADSANFTLSGWFNRDTFTTDDTILAKSNGQTAADTGYDVYIDDSTDKVTFVGNDGTDQYKLESVSTFTATGWHHYSIVWDESGANQTKLYINGVAEAATATGTFGSVNSLANSVAFRLGAESDGGNPFDGKLDEARLYSRALSGDEVTQLYRLNTPTAVDTGLKGYWSFNGQDTVSTTTFDRSGAGNTGTLTLGPTKAIGKIGQALSFDNSDDYVSIADNAVLDVTDTDDLTLTGWFYRNGTGTGDVLFAKRNGILAAQTGYAAYIGSGSNKLVFELSDGTDEYVLDSTSTFTTTVNPGWNHFAIVWDQDSAANSEIYINGAADSATDTGTIGNIGSVSNALILALGAQSDGATPFNGRLDEMRLYKRTLSAAEIASLYNQSR